MFFFTILVQRAPHIIQGVQNIFDKVITSWPQLISKFLVAPTCLPAMLLLIGLVLFYTPGVYN